MKGRSIAEMLAGALVLAVAVGFLGYALLHSGRSVVSAEGTLLTARFDRIDGLTNGADVRVAGVKVGTVTDTRIDPATFTAEIVLRIDRALRLPRDSSAEITSEGLLGGKYVSIAPGGAESVLGHGDRITETQGAVSLESLLGRFIFSVTQLNTNQAGGGAEGAAPAAPGAAPGR